MTTATTARHAVPVVPAPRPGRALVVVGDTVPGWALRWCARDGREVRLCTVPGRQAAPVSAERVGAIADIAVGAARDGNPVLALPPASPVRDAPPRVVAAVRELPDDAAALSGAAASARHMGADLVVAHGLPASFGERSVGLDGAARDAAGLLDTAVAAALRSEPDVPVRARLARVQPHELVGEQLDADLLVLGGPRTDRAGSLGLVARSALFHAPCAVLLVPRPARPA